MSELKVRSSSLPFLSGFDDFTIFEEGVIGEPVV